MKSDRGAAGASRARESASLRAENSSSRLCRSGLRNPSAIASRSQASARPAIAQGIAQHIGSVQVGKRADLILWSPAFFGVKPNLVLLGGSIAAAPMGDPNASVPTSQPVHYRPMFAAYGKAQTASSVTFVSQASPRRRPQAYGRGGQRSRRGAEHARQHLQGLYGS